MDDRPLIVSIYCLVYNHEPFLRQCLDGFVMQQTNFRFEAVVHDDVSTDGSADIIREYATKYPEIIKPIYETENQFKKGDGSLDRIMSEACTGKYIAFCEGDDFWTDSQKLQKQVDFLEANPEYGVAYSSYKTVGYDGNDVLYKPSLRYKQRSVSGDIFLDLLMENFPQTLTLLYRKDILTSNKLNPPYSYDYTWCLELALKKAKFKFFNEEFGAYRINPNGLIQSNSMNWVDTVRIQLFFLQEYFSNDLYRREKKKDREIVRFMLKCCCGFHYYVKYFQYFKGIIKGRPLLLFLLPVGVIEAQKRRFGIMLK